MRRAARAGFLWALGLSLSSLVCAAASIASPLPPAELSVQDGEEAWHPGSRFRLDWKLPKQPGAPAVAAAHYRVRDPQGEVVVRDTRLAWPAESLEVEVPAIPGAYLAEVWLEDATGAQGPPTTARLRFDDARPGLAEPLPEPAWIGRDGFPYTLRIAQPQGTLPLSGIRGYAISLDSTPQGNPCRAADRCAETEIDLPGGAANDSLPIIELPEGMTYVHAVAVSGSRMKSKTVGEVALRVDKTYPVTHLFGVPGEWVNRSVALRAAATDSLSGMSPVGGGLPPFTAIRVDARAPVVASGTSVSATVIAEGVHTVAYYARDAAGNVDDGGDANGKKNAAPAAAVVRIDRTPPAVAFTNSQDPREPEAIRARVLDNLSGPSRTRGTIGVRRTGSARRFQDLPSQMNGELLIAHWDSDRFPPGDYEFRAVGFDAAGNSATTLRRSNGGRMVLANPLKGGTALVARLAAPAGPRPVSSRATVTFSGRLTSARGRPLAGLPVRVVERFEAGAGDAVRVSTAATGAGGRFAVRLGPGPSREVRAVFEGTRTLARASAAPLTLPVRPPIRFGASSRVATVGGRPLVFRGKVGAEPNALPAGGAEVQLQFRAKGLPWSEFRTVHTDRRGRFRYAYRFSDDDSRGVRFRFRAFVPAQDDWPYEPWGSRPVAVRGR